MAKAKNVEGAKDASKSLAEQLRDVVNETTGTALTISPNDEGWGGYMLQKKKKFDAASCDELCQKMIDEIVSNRTKAEIVEGKKAPKKPFKY